MTDREKLIEIARKKPYNLSELSAGILADHLIASGVTVRKTGRWIDNCCYKTCSVCQKSVHVWNDDGDMQNFDFCPNCGARMEAEHD